MTEPGVGDLSPVPSQEGAVSPASGSCPPRNYDGRKAEPPYETPDDVAHWKAKAESQEQRADDLQVESDHHFKQWQDAKSKAEALERERDRLNEDRETYRMRALQYDKEAAIATTARDQWRSRALWLLPLAHHGRCEMNEFGGQWQPKAICTCGLDALRKAIEQEKGK